VAAVSTNAASEQHVIADQFAGVARRRRAHAALRAAPAN
jgi:hypothetical protein